MKQNSISLYQLIHQLSPSEKRYFKLFSQRHSKQDENAHLSLYHEIERNKAQNDHELSYQNSKTPLSVAKIQLFHYILDSLHQYHSSNSSYEALKIDEHKANLLSQRGLNKEALKLIQKTMWKAENKEYFSLYLGLHQLENQIISKTYYRETSFQELEERQLKLQLCFEKLQNLEEYNLLFSQIYKFHFQKVKSKSTEDLNRLKIWFEHELLQSEEKALSSAAKIIYYQLKALENFLKNHTSAASQYNLKILKTIEKNQLISEGYAQKYLAILNNYLIDCLQLKDHENFKHGLSKLKALPSLAAYKSLKDTEAQVFRTSNQLELNFLLNQGKFQEILKLEPSLLAGLKKHKNKLAKHSEISFYYLLMYAHFACKNFKKCLDYTEILINQKNEQTAEALIVSASLVSLLAHYELGNEQLLSYSISNLRKFQKRRKLLFQLEALILSSISSLIKLPKAERKDSYLKFRSSLLKLREEDLEKGILANFDYLAWVDSKLQGLNFDKIYQINRNNKS